MKVSATRRSSAQAPKLSSTASPTPLIPARYNPWLLFGLPLFLLGLTWLVYYTSLSYPFEFDDHAGILQYFNARNSSFGSLLFKGSRWICYWLNSVYYSLSPASGKFDPYLYRVGNVITHSLAGLFAYITCILAFRRSKHTWLKTNGLLIALLTAGLFLLHPVQTQTISYVIQGQLEGLAGLFILAMAACFLAYTSVQSFWARFFFATLLLILAAFACGSKEIVMVTPLLLVLLDWFFVAQGSWASLRQRWWLHGLVFLIVIGFYVYFLKPSFFSNVLGMRVEFYSNLGNRLTEEVGAKITPYYFCISQFKVLLHYLWIFIWPRAMSMDYDWQLSRSLFAPDAFVPLLVLCALFVWILLRLRKNHTDLLSFGFLWFFIVAAPRSSFIPSTELLADYKTYTGSFGIFFLLALAVGAAFVWMAHRFTPTRSMLTTLILSFLFLGGVGALAYTRNFVWSSPEAFWLDVIDHAPRRARAYNNYAVPLCKRQKYLEAIPYLQKAIEMDPYYADPYINLSVAYAQTKRLDLAIETLRIGMRLMPYHPEVYNNLATFLMEKKELGEIEALIATALKLRPFYGKAYYNLGNYYVMKKEYEKAWQAYKDACTKADFDNETGYARFGEVSAHLGKYEDAIWAYQKLAEVLPNSLQARFNLGEVCLLAKKYAQAEQIFSELYRREPRNIGLALRLADVSFTQGNYRQAAEYLETVLQKDRGFVPGYLRLADCYARLGNRARARAVLQSFLALNPPDEHKKTAQQALARLG